MSNWTLERHGPENFWLAHVRLGVATSSVVVAVVALYLFTTPDLPGRDVLWIVLSFGAAITVAAALTPWRRILAVHSPERYLLAWSATVVIVIVVLASEDGGSTSPMTALLVLPLVFTAAAYPVRSVVGVGALTVAGRLAIAFAAPPVHLGQTAMQVAILLVLTVMSALISRNQRRALARTQDLAARLERLASVDSLTGCFNHRGFHERLEAEAARAIREDLPLALLHLDLDHFKAVCSDGRSVSGSRQLPSARVRRRRGLDEGRPLRQLR